MILMNHNSPCYDCLFPDSPMDEEAREKLASAVSLEAVRQTRLSEIDVEISRKKAAAEKEVEELAAAELQNAREQAEKILCNARTNASAEKERIVSSAGREIAELAAAAADKLMKEALQHE